MLSTFGLYCGPSLHHRSADKISGVNAVAIGRVGRREVIISGSGDMAVRIWDAITGQPIGDPLAGHDGPVCGVAVGNVKKRHILVSEAADGKVQIWDVVTGHPICAPLVGHKGEVTAVAIGTGW